MKKLICTMLVIVCMMTILPTSLAASCPNHPNNTYKMTFEDDNYTPNSTHHIRYGTVLWRCNSCNYQEEERVVLERNPHSSKASPIETCGQGMHYFRKDCSVCGYRYVHYKAACDGVNHPACPYSVPHEVQ